MPRSLVRSLASCGLIAAALTSVAATAREVETIRATFISNAGTEIGSASVRGGAHGVVVRIELMPGSLTPGWHGLHFHAVGDCSDRDKFLNAKAHVNHNGAPHGLLNPGGPEAGDLPNLWVMQDGSARAEIASQLVRLRDGPHALLTAFGSSLIIHAGEDDHASQPIGNSGARVACAVIK